MLWTALLLACDPGPAEVVFAPAVAGEPAARPETSGEAPLIPAWSAAWAREVPPFVADPAFYGEASWDDVRGRVVQHQMTALRDRAQLAAERGDLAGAAARYAEAVAWAEAHPVQTGTGAALHALYLSAARRDAALLAALAAGRPPPIPAAGLARVRALALAGADLGRIQAEVDALDLRPVDSAGFADFQDRHALRLRLVEAALDATDPLRLSRTWGPWDDDARWDAVQAIERSAPLPPGGEAALPRGRVTRSVGASAFEERPFAAARLGALPTGDSWIDVAGEPGPAAIGRLEVLGLDDPAHAAWLDAQGARLSAAMGEGPGAPLLVLGELRAALAGTPWTSAYYSQKSASNEVIRQLASAGRYAEAAAVIDAMFPLRGQDLAAPNREGVLRGIQARLLALAGDPRADEGMRLALQRGDDFLARMDEVSGGAAPTKAPP